MPAGPASAEAVVPAAIGLPEVAAVQATPERAGLLTKIAGRAGELALTGAVMIRDAAVAAAVKAREAAPVVAKTVVERGPELADWLHKTGALGAADKASRAVPGAQGKALRLGVKAAYAAATVHQLRSAGQSRR